MLPCQVRWLREELEKANEDSNITGVFIAAHVPPGFFERNPEQPMFNVKVNATPTGEDVARLMAKTLRSKKWTRKLKGSFFGHTHTDSFRLFVDDAHIPQSAAFIQSSLTPMQNHKQSIGVNPSVRLYHYDTEEGVLLDYEQHYLPLEKANSELVDVVEKNDRRRLNDKRMRLDGRSRRDDTDDIDQEESASRDDQDTTVSPQNKNEVHDGELSSAGSLEVEREEVDSDLLDHLVGEWTFGYKATKAFHAQDLSAKSMYLVYRNLLCHPGGTDFALFMRHNTVFNSVNISCGYNNCHPRIMCAIVSFTLEEREDCLKGPLPPAECTDPESEAVMEEEITSTASSNSQNSQKQPDNDDLDSTSSSPVGDEMSDHPELMATSVPENHWARGIAIGFCLVLVLGIAVGGIILYRQLHRRSPWSRADEFLLTDSVFRYDGYSQVDAP